MKKLTVLCMLGLFVLVSANTDSIAAPREDTVKKCNDGKDNDGDGDIDELDLDCDGVGEDPSGGGGGGGNEPPPDCPASEQFPGFLYATESTRKAQSEAFIAGSDGCRSEPVPGGSSVHFADDGSGIIVWTEELIADNQDIVLGQTFELLGDGSFSTGLITQLLPLPDEVPQIGDFHRYWSLDLWGNSDHSELYLSAFRVIIPETAGDKRQVLIYTLDATNGLTVTRREILYTTKDVANPSNVTWTCPDNLSNPEFVATCYDFEGFWFNASGTRLFGGGVNRDVGWQANFKLDVISAPDPQDPISRWNIGDPEIVLAGSRQPSALYVEPGLRSSRPASDRYVLPSPEYAMVGYIDFTGNITVRGSGVLNIDKCVQEYAALNAGMLAGTVDIWRTNCFGDNPFFWDHVQGFSAWQSEDAILDVNLQNNKRSHLFRYFVSGPSQGVSEQLIESVESVDAGN